MTLVLGARHVVTGTGQFAISNPVGVAIALAGIPAYVARDTGTPQRFHRMGRVQLGTSIGWRPSVDLVVSPQLVWPLEGEDTVMGYTLLAGCTATVDEVASSSSYPMKLQPWDRAAAAFAMNAAAFAAGGTDVTLWTYTVPAGRCLWLASAELKHQRYAANAAAQSTIISLLRGGVAMLTLTRWTGSASDHEEQQLSPSGMVLFPGEILRAAYTGGGADGQDNVQASASGFTFAL